MKACFVASSGGHWEELMCMKSIADEHDTFYVTEAGGQARDSSLKNIYLLPQINRRQKDFPWRFLKLLFSAGLPAVTVRVNSSGVGMEFRRP